VRLPVDDRVRQFIRQQVADGIHNVAEVQRHTEVYVRRQLFEGQHLPSKFNRRFYPHRRDYENIIYRARVAAMKSLVDQENLRLKVDEWKLADPNVCVIFRPYVDPESTADFVCLTDADGNVEVHCGGQPGLLFVHQTPWQRRLLRRYGSICLLDATYKTTRYALPLFFLCVRTNVHYIVVATFVTQNEDSSSIAEALHIIRSWNPEWTATSFMVDFCEAEINALNSVFTGFVHLFCRVRTVTQPQHTRANSQQHCFSPRNRRHPPPPPPISLQVETSR